MRKFVGSLAAAGLFLAGLSLGGCATEELYDSPPPSGYYDGYDGAEPGWYDGYGYGFGAFDVGGYYGGWWDRDHHWHHGDWRGAHANYGHSAVHDTAHAGGSYGGHAGGGGHVGGGGHR